MKQRGRIATLILLSLGLLCLLFFRAGLTGQFIVNSFSEISSWALLCVVFLTGANIAFGTVKWLLVVDALAPNGKLSRQFTEAMLTTTVGALIGQAVPLQIAMAFTRSLAGRFGVGFNPSVNLGATACEQLFDAFVLCAAAILTLLGVALRLSAFGWVVLILLSVLFSGFIAVRLPFLLLALAQLLGRMSSAGRIREYATRLTSGVGRASDLLPSLVIQLIALSALRYLANLARIGVVLSALGLSTYLMPAAIAFPFILLITFLPITPGNLGVIEWTWSAMLVSAGAGVKQAALFALTSRMASIVALSILVTLLFGFHLFKRSPLITSLRKE
jgi:uncharacterized protein (TIRG00374 family)